MTKKRPLAEFFAELFPEFENSDLDEILEQILVHDVAS